VSAWRWSATQQEPSGPWRDIAVALALQIGPDRAAADAALKNVIAKYADTGPYQIAEVYALRRNPDNVFKWLGNSWKARDPGVSTLLYDPLDPALPRRPALRRFLQESRSAHHHRRRGTKLQRFDTIPYRLYSSIMKTTAQPVSKGAEEARQQLPAILSAAESGRTTLITRHGRNVAAVVPASAVKQRVPVSLLALAGTGRGMWGQGSARTIARIRDEWNR
jgi:prevent-host-death family protein